MGRPEVAREVLRFVNSVAPLYPHGLARPPVDSRPAPRLLFLSAPASADDRKLYEAIVTQGLRLPIDSCALCDAGIGPEGLAQAKRQFRISKLVIMGASMADQPGVFIAPSFAAISSDVEIKRGFWIKLKQFLAD